MYTQEEWTRNQERFLVYAFCLKIAGSPGKLAQLLEPPGSCREFRFSGSYPTHAPMGEETAVSEDVSVERLSVYEAAEALGVTRDAIHKRRLADSLPERG